jgi:hypothetical protein
MMSSLISHFFRELIFRGGIRILRINPVKMKVANTHVPLIINLFNKYNI